MYSSERKLLVQLAILYLIIAVVDAKALTKREAEEETNYFEDLLNQLNKVKTVPILGDIVAPYITEFSETAIRIDKWSEGSMSSLVNSIFPCNFNRFILTCSGTPDRESLHKFVRKILTTLPIGRSVLPMFDLASNVI